MLSRSVFIGASRPAEHDTGGADRSKDARLGRGSGHQLRRKVYRTPIFQMPDWTQRAKMPQSATDPALRVPIVRAAAEMVRTRYCRDLVVPMYEEQYREVLG
jgi:hypothetical protein